MHDSDPDQRPSPTPGDSFPTQRMFSSSMEAELPDRIGGYRIRRKIAEGGMGVVFEAMQEMPRRKVALKIIKPGLVSPRELRRFEFESQVLARLRHHGIAQIYESGVHEGEGWSTPYFAMEYVPSPRTLLQYANKKQLGTTDRLRLFVKVLHAVQHGHQKGIIHRDLKPGNILVDPEGNPKVIDFGVARATDSDQIATTLQTDVGSLIGTLQYMSPEQFDADPDDLDVRSDVYALGVVLYELVCNELPYDLTSISLAEAARIVQQEVPARPSRSHAMARGDLETIMLTALDKDKDRRYSSALALAEDIERYLNHEPITARRPSAVYQIRMFARRHTGAFVGLAGIFLLLVASTVLVSVLLGRALDAERVARDQARVALEAEQRAEQATVEARTELERKNRLYDFMSTHLLRAVDPGTGEVDGHGFLANRPFRETIDRAVAVVSDEFDGQPELESRVRTNLGESYYNLGEYARAREQFEAARHLVDMSDGASESMLRLSFLVAMVDTDLSEDASELEDVQAELESIHGRQIEQLGAAHPDSLGTQNVLAMVDSALGRQDQAESRLRSVNELVEDGNVHRVSYMINLGSVLGAQGKFDEAIHHLDRAIFVARRFNREHVLATGLNQKSLFLSYDGKTSEALAICNEVVELNNGRLHEAHPHAINALGTKSHLLLTLGHHGQARDVLAETERRLVEHDRIDSEQWLDLLGNQAMLEYHDGRLDEAFRAFRRIEDEYVRLKGPRNTSAVIHGVSASVVLDTMGRSEEAISQLQRIIDRFTDDEQRTISAVLGARARLGQAMINLDRFEQGREMLEMVIADHVANGSPWGSEALYARHDLSRAFIGLEQWQDAVACSTEVIGRADDPVLKGMAMNVRARSHRALDDHVAARRDFEAAIKVLEQVGSSKRSAVIEELAVLEESLGNPDRAAELRATIPQ